ncbi:MULTISPECIES: type 1 glutamine amidotransferase domain-containing protein [Paenibacillus]|uniref:Glutamine amidotransferase n=1 Tax=Paenibacillus naphthalenovorans TaxID=162209 RepID=A0A0U2UFI4_9BACL|nr:MULTISPECIES: type 1 glutamine amidotransferase domain-containing protein [Paenibacillus]ALS21948.1 glutamine amidotransferase [Paenibacillus naphthalenovorans]NTZ16681.1 type 1 glutamine amidotransferase [Paenibacillus sp. JMULE4]SDJ73339.1 protease I [Paenibacillus naphthalenovorans]
MRLNGRRVALLIEDDYQELEAWYPVLRLQEEGATVVIVGSGRKSTYHSKLGYPITADRSADEVKADEFDAVVIPGGFAPDHMRLSRPMVNLVRKAYESGKLTAAICHGGWMLASAGAVRGRRVTGYLPIRDDVVNAGGEWVDAEVVCDGNVITSRTPEDLPAFAREIVKYLERASVSSSF